MATTQTNRPASKARLIVESFSRESVVDAEAGVVRDVKIIGFKSKNGRFYPPSVLKQAVSLYEGIKVNIDHPPKDQPHKERGYGERFGVLRNVSFRESSGLRGDLYFNPRHSLAEQFAWDVANNPEALGLSHNATLKLSLPNSGVSTVEQILAVKSVDVVADPATTESIFESEGDMPPTAPVAPESDPSAQVKAAFKSMILAAIDDPKLDMKATLKKIAELMKAQEKLMGLPASADPVAEMDYDKDKDKKMESYQMQIGLLKQEVESFRAREKQIQLVESINTDLAAAGLDPRNATHVSELFSKTLLATESADTRKAMILDRASLLRVAPRQSTGQPTYVPNQQQATESVDPVYWAKELMSR